MLSIVCYIYGDGVVFMNEITFFIGITFNLKVFEVIERLGRLLEVSFSFFMLWFCCYVSGIG